MLNVELEPGLGLRLGIRYRGSPKFYDTCPWFNLVAWCGKLGYAYGNLCHKLF